MLLAGPALAAGECKFKPQRPPVIKSMGPCSYDPETQSYAGDPVQQALCLTTPVMTGGKLGKPREALPDALAERVGRTTGLPDREALRPLLQERGLDKIVEMLDRPVAMAHDNDPSARGMTYFVIHDTSSPNYGNASWPRDLDEDARLNNLNRYVCANDIERAHVFINRGGAILLAHDFSVPWRATKFEMATNFDGALKGLFLHVELVQPRRRHPRYGRGNDFLAPDPGFSPAQYDALALVYAVASVRAGFWLIPAFHSVLDEGISNKHDDPQNFELADFAGSVSALLDSLKKPAMRDSRN
jgi:hypothetical protein